MFTLLVLAVIGIFFILLHKAGLMKWFLIIFLVVPVVIGTYLYVIGTVGG